MHFLDLTLGFSRNLTTPIFPGNKRGFKEMAPDTRMPMVRSNENNIIYSNSVKIH